MVSDTVKSVGVAWNYLARVAQGDLLMMANDDLVFKTPRWGAALYDAMNATGWDDGIFCAYCDDGAPKPEDRVCFPIVSRKWYETLGYLAPECFNFLWHDTWIGDIAKRINRALYVPTVLVEHRHFTFKKAEYDATYQRHRVGPENRKKRTEDQRTYESSVGLRQQHAKTLLDAIAAAGQVHPALEARLEEDMGRTLDAANRLDTLE